MNQPRNNIGSTRTEADSVPHSDGRKRLRDGLFAGGALILAASIGIAERAKTQVQTSRLGATLQEVRKLEAYQEDMEHRFKTDLGRQNYSGDYSGFTHAIDQTRDDCEAAIMTNQKECLTDLGNTVRLSMYMNNVAPVWVNPINGGNLTCAINITDMFKECQLRVADIMQKYAEEAGISPDCRPEDYRGRAESGPPWTHAERGGK